MKLAILACTLLTFMVVTTSNSCRFSQNNCYKEYAFEINFTCSPQKDTFLIGDTIWIESSIPSILTNQIDNTNANVKDMEYKFSGAIDRYNEQTPVSSEADFIYLNQIGSVSIQSIGPYNALNLVYQSDENSIEKLKVGCIPQKKGLYGITFYYLTEDYYFVDGVIDPECAERIEFTYNMNNNGDNNYHLLEGYPRIATAEGFKQGGSYAFWVVE